MAANLVYCIHRFGFDVLLVAMQAIEGGDSFDQDGLFSTPENFGKGNWIGFHRAADATFEVRILFSSH